MFESFSFGNTIWLTILVEKSIVFILYLMDLYPTECISINPLFSLFLMICCLSPVSLMCSLSWHLISEVISPSFKTGCLNCVHISNLHTYLVHLLWKCEWRVIFFFGLCIILRLKLCISHPSYCRLLLFERPYQLYTPLGNYYFLCCVKAHTLELLSKDLLCYLYNIYPNLYSPSSVYPVSNYLPRNFKNT